MDKYAVFGNPIAQSKSPIIHKAFASQFGDSIDYQAILGEKDKFVEAIEGFFSDFDTKGCNLTMPFKQDAAAWVNRLAPEAELAGAVNTIKRERDGSYTGYNTDGVGLVHDLLAHDVALSAKRILMLGAGGAARGVLHPLLAQQPDRLTIANRSKDKAVALSKLASSANVRGVGLAELSADQNYDVIINSTSASLQLQLPDLPDDLLANAGTVYDMVYGKQDTIFMQHAKKLGVAKTLDGLGMLVGQAAESYRIWRDKQPDSLAVLAMLRGML